MIESLKIQNFRCFQNARLDGLKRVNIVTGRNATGKTVLLESLFLAAGGSPLNVLKLRAFRGMGEGVRIDNTTLKQLWEDLFWCLNTTNQIEISAEGSDHDSRSATIKDVGSAVTTLASDETTPQTEAPFEFTWQQAGRKPFSTRPKLTPQGLQMENSPVPSQVVMFPANFTLNVEETSGRLSAIRKKGELPFLLQTIAEVFPDVKDISVENNIGVWMVYISTPQVTSQMIPMALNSAGVNRFVAILLGIASAPRGTVLVDEIENGLYYKTLPQVWRAIYRFADRYKTQIFGNAWMPLTPSFMRRLRTLPLCEPC
jgi:hypothetical protein